MVVVVVVVVAVERWSGCDVSVMWMHLKLRMH